VKNMKMCLNVLWAAAGATLVGWLSPMPLSSEASPSELEF
jgi:hypothetical protein